MELPSEMAILHRPGCHTSAAGNGHTPLSETYGIPDDEVWHFGE